ncbi:hypothetical protein [Neobacillus niacini]|uniref:hypothetical protein n=1 Tax=Neobacillus niacini TaxID=86668 RepID=UPI0028583BC1|nr:hypothetical protein [Neobacillus niacini]MDR6999626.1 hypothetical protein [Neobacillus niacini]
MDTNTPPLFVEYGRPLTTFYSNKQQNFMFEAEFSKRCKALAIAARCDIPPDNWRGYDIADSIVLYLNQRFLNQDIL